MLRSMFTGISGLSVHQTMLDVTSNNIANVNTTGFKSASTRFEDTFSQLVKSGAAPRLNERGGMNPAQVGLGVKLQSITNNFTGGAAQNTGRNLDTMINGDGFFVLKKTNGTQVYTRNGSFGLDAQGQVVAADGSFVQGWKANTEGKVNASGQPKNITLPLTQSIPAAYTSKIIFGGNMPADQIMADPDKGMKDENAKQFTQVRRVFDDKGNPHDILMMFTRTNMAKGGGVDGGSTWAMHLFDAATYEALPEGKKSKALIEIKDGDDAEISLKGETNKIKGIAIKFDKQGQVVDPDKKLEKLNFKINGYKLNDAGDDVVKDDKITDAKHLTTMDLSKLTGFGGLNNFAVDQANGNAAGTLTGFGVEADGTIRGTFSNGDSRALAKIATAAFSNPLGLEKAGASYFVESGNSGQAQIGEPGSGSRGKMTGGAIEMSNVDLAAEFTNLILSQRGFQANTRVITTSDEILQELVSMKR
ncbi:flagellar hook protein FlgE [Mobiluncus mulieris]|uniref:flagellar hook protein FlgE n=1 Tax=Mobiluncus mulieris TaxID=2052 RepID=UPI0024316450|nr:flagellar hook protein FlgE [Mobiluncus mulieris]